MSICYKPYVSSHKNCKKTTVIERVTCVYCRTRLLKENKAKVTRIEKKED